MKKFITLGVAAMGLVGFLGIGASSASASPIGPDHIAICAALNTSALTLGTQNTAATTALGTANTAYNAAKAALTTAEGVYGSALNQWVVDTDAGSVNVNADAVAFSNAYNGLVSAITTWSTNRVAVAAAQATADTVGLQNTIITSLVSSLSC